MIKKILKHVTLNETLFIASPYGHYTLSHLENDRDVSAYTR